MTEAGGRTGRGSLLALPCLACLSQSTLAGDARPAPCLLLLLHRSNLMSAPAKRLPSPAAGAAAAWENEATPLLLLLLLPLLPGLVEGRAARRPSSTHSAPEIRTYRTL